MPEAPAKGGHSPGNLVRAIRWLFHLHFQDERRERQFLASGGFLVTLAIAWEGRVTKPPLTVLDHWWAPTLRWPLRPALGMQ